MELFYLLSNQLIFDPNLSWEQLKLLINYQIYFCSIYNDKLFFIFWILYLNILNNNLIYSKLDDLKLIFEELYQSVSSNKIHQNYLVKLIAIYFCIFDYYPFSTISHLIERESKSYLHILKFIKYGDIDFYINQVINNDNRYNHSQNISNQQFIELFNQSSTILSNELIDYINSKLISSFTIQNYHTQIIKQIYNIDTQLLTKNYIINNTHLHPKYIYFQIFLKPEFSNCLFISQYFGVYLGLTYFKSKCSQKYQYLYYQLDINCWKYFFRSLNLDNLTLYINNNELISIIEEIKIFLGIINKESNFNSIDCNIIFNSIQDKFNIYSNQNSYIEKPISNLNLQFNFLTLSNIDLEYKNLYFELFIDNNLNHSDKIKVSLDKYKQLIQYLLGYPDQSIIIYPIWNNMITQKKNLIPIIFNCISNNTYIVWKRESDTNIFNTISKDYQLLLENIPDNNIQVSVITTNISNQYNIQNQKINFIEHNLKLNKQIKISKEYDYIQVLISENNQIINMKSSYIDNLLKNNVTGNIYYLNYFYNLSLICINFCIQNVVNLGHKILLYFLEFLNY